MVVEVEDDDPPAKIALIHSLVYDKAARQKRVVKNGNVKRELRPGLKLRDGVEVLKPIVRHRVNVG